MSEVTVAAGEAGSVPDLDGARSDDSTNQPTEHTGDSPKCGIKIEQAVSSNKVYVPALNRRDSTSSQRLRKKCSQGVLCSRLNPAHLKELSHPHLEDILDKYSVSSEYEIPNEHMLNRTLICDQLNVIVEKRLYQPKNKININQNQQIKNEEKLHSTTENNNLPESQDIRKLGVLLEGVKCTDKLKSEEDANLLPSTIKCTDYKPIVPPTENIQDYFKVVRPTGEMAAKHEASAPYHIFYTTITDSRETHDQPYSITFQEILDVSLGELKFSLQISFMVEIPWLLKHYYFAGYSAKDLCIIYGREENPDESEVKKDLEKIDRPNVTAHYVTMAPDYGIQHSKIMILCYEDGSLRVVISTANLCRSEWENWTQGLWFSPRCPELPAGSAPDAGESPTMFKRSLLEYLYQYRLPDLAVYVERVRKCDFSHINVFLVSSVPGFHYGHKWGSKRVGSLLQQHCCIPPRDNPRWPLIAQASSIGNYGKKPSFWLRGVFVDNFTKTKRQWTHRSQAQNLPDIQLIYPSIDNVKQSYDGEDGDLPLAYDTEIDSRQPWLKNILYQWRARSTARDRAMPHIKSYTRVSHDHKMAAFYLLTSANVSKSAWGYVDRNIRASRIFNYEAGVLLLPQLMIKQNFFPLEGADRLVLPYDLPATKYAADMSPYSTCRNLE